MTDVDEPLVSVVLPVFNGVGTILEELSAIVGQRTTVQWELIVVDNGSTDDTGSIVDTLAASDSRVRRVNAPHKHNLSYVRNVGVQHARGRFVLFCDDDDVVDEHWLEAMAKGLTEHPFVVSRMEYDRLNPSSVMRGRAKFQSQNLASLFGYKVANGAIGIHRDVWNRLSGNDEHLGVAGEDFDFAIRAQRDLGITPVLVDDAIYHYRQRAGAKTTWIQARRYGRSHVALYRRYGEGRVDLRAERRQALRDWWWIITRAPLLYRPDKRVRWTRKAGMRLGRLTGSIRERTFYL